MARAKKSITFSLPPDMVMKIEEIRKEEGMSMSELVREAVRRYIEKREWREVLSYGERKAAEQQIAEDDVERLIDEYRSEAP